MPVLTPAELWEQSGRDFIQEIFRLKDRKGADLRPAADARGDRHLPRPRAPELPAAAADALPLLDQGARRAAPGQGADPPARVHHEGRLLVRPRRGGARQELRAPARRVRADLRALRALDVRRRGRAGDDGRQRVHRLPRARRGGREHARQVRERRLRRRHRGRSDDGARDRLPGDEGGAGRGRDARREDVRGARRVPRDRRGCDVEGDAGHDRRGRRARAHPRRRPDRAGEARRGARRCSRAPRPTTRSARRSAPPGARSAPSASPGASSPTRRCARASTSPAPTATAGTSAASRPGATSTPSSPTCAPPARATPARTAAAGSRSRRRSRSGTSSSSARGTRMRSARGSSARTAGNATS